VIGSDRVSEEGEAVSVLDGLNSGGGFLGHSSEEWRKVDIGRVFSPCEQVASRSFKFVPSLVSSQSLRVEFLEELGSHGGSDNFLDLGSGRPDVLEHDRLAFLVETERLSLEVNVNITSNGVGNNERRTGEVVTSGQGVDTSLEVSVSGEDSAGDHILILDTLLDLIGESSRVSNARHASITSGSESEFVHVGVNSSDLEVAGDDTRAGGEGGLDVRTGSQSLGDGILAEESSLEHNTGVGSVGARSNSSDGDSTVGEVVLLSFVHDLGNVVAVLFGDTESLEASGGSHAIVEILLHVFESDSVMGTLGSGQARLDSVHIKLHHVGGVSRINVVLSVFSEEALGTEVSFNHGDLLGGLTNQSEVIESLLVGREESHSCSVLRRHVSDGGSVSQTEVDASRSEEFDELADNTSGSKHVSDGENEISSSGVLRKVTN